MNNDFDPTVGNDNKFALGAVAGGTANLLGNGAVALAGKAMAVKCVGAGAIKAGAALAMCNPVVGTIALIGGAGHLLYKACK